MHLGVCTLSPHRAILAPFLPAPTPVPEVCACGELLEMEIERDMVLCVDCQLEAAILRDRAQALFLIWSFRHKAWWRAEGAGYTTKKADAGRFTFGAAMAQSLDPVDVSGRGPSGDALIKEAR